MSYIIIFTLIYSMALSEETSMITTEDCYKTADCFLLPEYCTNSDNCDVLVKYNFDSISKVIFITLSTNGKWVGFAQTNNLNMTQKMQNIKGEICFNNNTVATLVNFHALRNTRPKFSAVVSGVNAKEMYILPSGSVVCKYSRSLFASISSEEYMLSLNETVDVVYAHGTRLGGDGYPSYHGKMNHSYYSEKVDMKKIRSRSESLITTEDCYKTADCFLLPEYCTNSDNCDVLVKYNFDSVKSMFSITLATNKIWVGFAQTYNLNMTQKMQNIKGEICFNNNSIASIANFHGLRNTKPNFFSLLNGIDVKEMYVLPSGSVVCKYSRSLLAPVGSEEYMFSLDQPVNVVYAYGMQLRNDGYPSYHGPKNHSYYSEKVDMKKIRPRSDSLITTEDCYKTADCFLLPEYCTNSDNCDVLVKYNFDSVKSMFSITLATNKIWVGFAQTYNLNMTQKMQNIKGEICFNNNSIASIANFHGLRNTKPNFFSLLNGIDVKEMYVLPSGSVVCKYSRSLLAPVGSEEYMFSLDQPVNVVYAYGMQLRNDGYPSYHGPKNHSYYSEKVDMKKIRPRSDSLMDFSKCGKEFSCFLKPAGCIKNCKVAATFEYDANSEKVIFQLWASKSLKYVAFGQRPDNNNNFMIKIRGEYCSRSQVVGFGHFNGNNLNEAGTPQWVSEVDQVKLLLSEVLPDDSFFCRYERPLVLSSKNMDYLYDMSYPLYAAIAFGNSLSENFPDYHNGHEISSNAINFKVVNDVSIDTLSIQLKKAHGSLMVLSWILFVTCGIFMSRYMKPFLTNKIAGKDAWFRIHHIFMLSALLCMIVGFIIILVFFKGKLYLNDIHHSLGFSVFILGLLQPVLATFRCAPDHKNRVIFNWVHRFIGMTSWLIAVLAVVFGLKKLSIDIVPIIVFACVVLVLFISLDIIQLFVIRSSAVEGSTYAKFISKSDSANNLEVNAQVKKKISKCHYIFMATIYAISCGVAIYYVVMIIKS
ncbi:uncharacterized protein LOC100213924 isoform X2 [Hydra vulgaris]|uniref:Uncharacterized protein LOC100213924 isoform X2 n=1 Tax=Hydra vulgaris TaxID=6087 RepID=A0ABM4BJU5_HYDVU